MDRAGEHGGDAAGAGRDPERRTLRIVLVPRSRGRFRLWSPNLEELVGRETFRVNPVIEAPPVGTGRADSGGPGGPPSEGPARGPEAPGKARRALAAGRRWLERRGGATERVLRAVRDLETVEVWYPAVLGEPAARTRYRELVEEAVEKHGRWLLVDGVLLPLSAVLSLVPGPNLLFAYLAWRTLGHWRGRRGGARALSDLKTRFVAVPGLDPLVHLAGRRFVLRRRALARPIGERLGIEGLDRAL